MTAATAYLHGITVSETFQTPGLYGKADITASDGTDTLLYTVPGSVDYIIFSVGVTNREDVALENVNIAIASSAGGPLDSEFIEWNTTLVPRGVVERTQLMASPGDSIFVRIGSPIGFTNGDFATGDLTGWTLEPGNVGLPSVVNNQLVLQPATTMLQTISNLIPGENYEITFDVVAVSGTDTARVYIDQLSNDARLVSTTNGTATVGTTVNTGPFSITAGDSIVVNAIGFEFNSNDVVLDNFTITPV